MAQRISRLAESWTYILRSDRELPPEQQTVFRLRPMTQGERMAAMDDVSRISVVDGEQVVVDRSRQMALVMCRDHIETVENFPVGAPQPWPTGAKERAAYLEQFADDDVAEVGNEIFTRSTIGRTEKN